MHIGYACIVVVVGVVISTERICMTNPLFGYWLVIN